MSVRRILSSQTDLSNQRSLVDGYEVVDLGLPSGTLWATSNIGSDGGKETSFGNYYQWGKGDSTILYTMAQVPYTGTTDPLPLTYDTAYKCMGGNWRMPTASQFQELFDNTDISVVTIEDVKGTKFTSKINPEAYIFFPHGGSWYDIGNDGNYPRYYKDINYAYYWTASYGGEKYRAYAVHIGKGSHQLYISDTSRGFNVRAVINQY